MLSGAGGDETYHAVDPANGRDAGIRTRVRGSKAHDAGPLHYISTIIIRCEEGFLVNPQRNSQLPK